MSSSDPIYMDASQPADLHVRGDRRPVIVAGQPLKAVLQAYHRLSSKQRLTAFIALPGGGAVLKSGDIDRLSFDPKPK